MIKNEIDINDILKNNYNVPSSVYDGKYTKTTQFLLPAIDVNIKDKTLFKYFLNAFIDDKEHVHSYTRPVFILLGTSNFKDKEWNKVYTNLFLNKNYVLDYDCGVRDGLNLVMVVFEIPEKYKHEYYSFKLGRYSMFSKEYKEKFPQFVGEDKTSQKESIIYQILYKSPALKRIIEKEFNLKEYELDSSDTKEIWDLPRKEREYYRYSPELCLA